MLVVVQLAVTVALLGWLFSRSGFLDEFRRVIAQAEPGWLAGALALALASHVLGVVRWGFCLGIVGLSPGCRRIARYYAICRFATLAFIGVLGGDAARIALLWRDGHPKAVAMMSVALERLEGMVGLVVAGLVLTVFRRDWLL